MHGPTRCCRTCFSRSYTVSMASVTYDAGADNAASGSSGAYAGCCRTCFSRSYTVSMASVTHDAGADNAASRGSGAHA